jgi:hypothetical protein
MARPEDIAALEALTPWDQPAFRAGLAQLSASTAAAARQYAADARVLAALAAQVPRCAGDETGASPWTSFRREVAVARQVSDQAAAAELRTALRLTGVLACTLALLEAGRITVSRARTLAEQLEPHDDTVAAAVDAELAERAAVLAPWRIKDAVRRAVLRHDPDAAAVRAAAATAARDVRLVPADDGQATVVLTGPAVPLTRWYATLDRRARALRTAGDPRTLAALRFDLAVSRFPCTTHSPATSGPATSSPADAWTAPAGLRPTGWRRRGRLPAQPTGAGRRPGAGRDRARPQQRARPGWTGTAGSTPRPAGSCSSTPSSARPAPAAAPERWSTGPAPSDGHRPTRPACGRRCCRW